MNNFLKNLQNKPEPVKKMIMWAGIAVIITVIFSFWLLNFPSQIPQNQNDEAAANLKQELPGVWQALKSQVGELKNLWRK
ncbi:hypothetical protein HY838_00985 [Candidatus Azambacteria bacterium]|nr:hypothetical protein [Candidatus Azambacteria bacterium]